MNIAYVCNEYPPTPHGGIGSFVQTLARGLVKKCHEVTVVGLGERDLERNDCGVRVVTLRSTHLRGISWLLDRWRFHCWLLREAEKRKLDIIEVPDFQGMLPFRFDACPVVVRLHLAGTSVAMLMGERPGRCARWCEYRTLALHPNWIGVSHHAIALTTSTFGLRPSKCEVIYPPIVEEDESIPPPGLPENFVLYAGTVSERKGALLVAEAALRFLRKFPEFHLVYIGGIAEKGGVPLDSCIREIVGGELARRTHFLGRQPRAVVLAAMKKAKVFLFPSLIETFSLVVAEAMLMGCPVIVSEVPPFTEYITHGETGFLVRHGDVEALAAAVSELIQNRSFASRLAANGKRLIDEMCSLERALDKTLAFYEAIGGS